jgi:hypothetical protein
LYFSSFIVVSFTGTIIAIAIPQECTSNSWEKFYELHFHDINNGDLFGVPLGLVFSGGTGCYKGHKTVPRPDEVDKPESNEIPEWMKNLPGFQQTAPVWNQPGIPENPKAAPNFEANRPSPSNTFKPIQNGSPVQSAPRPLRTYIDPKNPNIVIVEVYGR